MTGRRVGDQGWRRYLPERVYRDVWLLFITGLVVWSLSQQASALSQQNREGERTTLALCALRSDLETRIHSSNVFLREHPNGVPGISPKLILDGIHNQQRTVFALQSLSCG